jgi:small subunit ribosomal protein S8
MLTRIRNANSARHDRVDIPASRLKEAIAKILKEEGYIKNFKVIEDERKHRILRVFLKGEGLSI